MPETRERITVTGYGLTLSKIVWRRFRKPMPDIVDRTLDANAGLAEKGPVLPYGTVFDLVIPGSDEATTSRPVVRLWGSS